MTVDISNELNIIKSTQLGRTMRPALHDSIEKQNKELNRTSVLIDEFVKNAKQVAPQNAEIVAARIDNHSNIPVVYATLGNRLDNMKEDSENKVATLNKNLEQTNAQLSQKANAGEVRYKSNAIMLEDLHTEVKKAMTGGSVGVVNEESVGYENIKLNSVKNAHIDNISIEKIIDVAVNQSINLFDNSKFVLGESIDMSTGAFIPQSIGHWGRTCHIYVEPNNKYRFNKIDGSLGSEVAFYDADLNFVSSKGVADTTVIVEIPNDARICYMMRTCDQWFGEKGVVSKGEEEITEFIPYNRSVVIENLEIKEAEEIQKISNEIKVNQSINLFDNSKFVLGESIDMSTGAFIPQSIGHWGRTCHIYVEPNNKYRFNKIDGSLGSEVAFYDADLNFVSSKGVADTTVIVEIPNDARICYMMRTCDQWFGEKGVVSKGEEEITEFIPYNRSVVIENLEVDIKKINPVSNDGTSHSLTVTDSGEIVAIPIYHLNNQKLFKFNFKGKSLVEEDYLITSTNLSQTAIVNRSGYVKNHKNFGGFNVKKYKLDNGDIRYTVATISSDKPINMNSGYYPTDLVIMDKNLNELKKVRMKGYGTVSDGYPGENHDYVYINDNHYILLSYHPNIVNNIPDLEGNYKVVNCVIQEVKNDEVLFHWEAIDYPELYLTSHANNNYKNFTESQDVYNDYLHINSLFIDKRDNNILISSRHCGIFKINRKDGNIMWFFGKNRCDFSGFDSNHFPLLQHDARYNYDNSITCYDNSGGSQSNLRICRYWIDEDTMTLIKFKEYISPYPKSPYMGSALLIDDELEVFDIAFGGPDYTYSAVEFSFKLQKSFMDIECDGKSPFYRICREGNYGQQL